MRYRSLSHLCRNILCPPQVANCQFFYQAQSALSEKGGKGQFIHIQIVDIMPLYGKCLLVVVDINR